MRRLLRLVALGGLVVGLGLVAACGGSTRRDSPTSITASAAPSSTPTVSTATSASPTPSPSATTPLLTGAAVKPGEVPPTQNPELITDDSGGAIAFAGYFYRALDWSIATTNANLLRPISAPGCTACQQYIHEIDALAATGGHSDGARLGVSAYAPAHGRMVQSDAVIQVTIEQDAQVFVSPDGSRHSVPPPPSPAINYLYMDWQDGSWHAVGIQLG